MRKENDLHIREFRPSKAMGQNFLADDNISKKIVRLAGVDKDCGVLEIGPGFGALTKHLAAAAGHVTAVEADRRLFESLRGSFVDCRNITLVHGDALKMDLGALAAETFGGLTPHVCANLPYSITTPVITGIIEAGVFRTATVMVQREVALRMCAEPGTPGYGSFTVFVNYHTVPGMLFDVPPGCFSPRPKVVSSVVKMTAREKRVFGGRELSAQEEKQFFRVVRASFARRRKTLVNALFAEFSATHGKDEISEIVQECGFDANIRGEVLGVEEFIRLSVTFC